MKVMLDVGAHAPKRAHETDAGLDLYAMESLTIKPGSWAKIDTGVHIEIPQGCVGLITSKSGLMSKGITCRGTIDCGYTGSIKAVLYNHSSDKMIVTRGDKITQLVVVPCLLGDVEIVDSLAETERGAGGFGSTGKR